MERTQGFWPEDEHVATAWAFGPVSGKRTGTRYFYEDDVAGHEDDNGFRWRPSYRAFREANDTPA